MTDKRVLIITYYWPPSGGSGVQRWLKFVKYLPLFGWQPYVFTPENPSFDIKDESLLNDVPVEAEVIKLPIWEPYKIFNWLSSRVSRKEKKSVPVDSLAPNKRTFFQRLSAWIRANLFIPDPRIFWIRPSVKFLHDFLIEKKITTIITTGPPHSMHLIGFWLKKKNPALHWIADFRDPWTEWGLWEKLGVGKLAMQRHRNLEQKVLTAANVVVSVTPHYIKRFEALSGRPAVLLTNGFDEDDFIVINYIKPQKFTIRHIGIVNEQRDPVPFMEAFQQLLVEHAEFGEQTVIEFVGEVYQPFKDYVHDRTSLHNHVRFTGNVSHRKVMECYGSTSLLLLILTGYRDPHGFFPGKLFEYIATGVPVLGIGPVVGDAATVLHQAGTGVMAESNDLAGIKASLLKYFKEWKSNPNPIVEKRNVSAYSRKVITERLVSYLK
ncbi:MAG: glycosyltransferase [Cyclobacteriaceae bacterium]|nr:glycosyltransferase [Cyclobacteriaceae bacterium]